MRAQCQSLVGFVRAAWHTLHDEQVPYVHGWHVDFIAKHLAAISDGTYRQKGAENRLLINVPPGTLKSLLVSCFFPAWEWGPRGQPHLQYICTSYREDLTLKHSRLFRQLVRSDWYKNLWPHVVLAGEAERRVANDRKGWREGIPFGSLTGGRADRLILDDPNSVEGAESDADRERAALRFRESATTRLNDPINSAIIVIMQRLHERDISGLIKSLGLSYDHIMLPMRFEKERRCETILGARDERAEGALLFPERFPPAVIDRDEKAMGSVAVAGQLQQRPAPRGGLLFKRHWLSAVKAVPGECTWVRGWDFAASTEGTSAYTCGVLLGYHAMTKHFYIGHVVRERVPNPEPVVKAYAQQDGRRVEISIPQDPGQASKIQVRSIIGACSGWTIRASPESGAKESRAMPVAAQAEAGNISYVDGQPWNEAFLAEWEQFPASAYKDQIDALSRAFSWFMLGGGYRTHGPIIITTPMTIDYQ